MTSSTTLEIPHLPHVPCYLLDLISFSEAASCLCRRRYLFSHLNNRLKQFYEMLFFIFTISFDIFCDIFVVAILGVKR